MISWLALLLTIPRTTAITVQYNTKPDPTWTGASAFDKQDEVDYSNGSNPLSHRPDLFADSSHHQRQSNKFSSKTKQDDFLLCAFYSNPFVKHSHAFDEEFSFAY